MRTILLGLTLLASLAPAADWPDITAQLQLTGNPLHDFGYRRTAGDTSVATTTLNDLRAYAGQLHLAYGDSGGGGGPKFPLAYDLATARWRLDSPLDEPWPEEQLDHFNLIGGELILHSYDGLRGGNRLYVRNAAGWRSLATDLGDHLRDTWNFAGRWWIAGTGHDGLKYPNIHTLPLVGEPGRFWPAPAEPPTAFTQANSFLGAAFFEFNGELHLSAGTQLSPINEPTPQPYLLTLDHTAPSPGRWRVGVAEARAWLGRPAATDQAVAPIASPVALPGPAPRLLFAHPLPSAGAALVVATGIANGTRLTVLMPDLPATSARRTTRPFLRDGRLFALTTQSAPREAPGAPTTLWLHECIDLARVAEPAAWTPRWQCRFPAFRAIEFVDGRFYLAQGFAYDYPRATGGKNQPVPITELKKNPLNPGYLGAGSVWVFDPAGPLPTAQAHPLPPATPADTPLTLTAEVTTGSAPIVAVRYYADDRLVAEARTATTSGHWPALWPRPSPGHHLLVAVAEDARGVRHGGGPMQPCFVAPR